MSNLKFFVLNGQKYFTEYNLTLSELIEYFNYNSIFNSLKNETTFGRKTWGLLSLEIWYKQFVDEHQKFKKLLN